MTAIAHSGSSSQAEPIPSFALLAKLQLLAGLIVLRSPSFFTSLADPDEAHYYLIGQALSKGGIPYVDIVDKKPVLTYVFYALAGLLGDGMWPVKLLGLLWIWATCLILSRAAVRWTGRHEVGMAAAWIYALLTSCNNLGVQAEPLMNLPVAAALLLTIRSIRSETARRDKATLRVRWDSMWIGLLIGIASLFRHQAGIVLAALVLPLVGSFPSDLRSVRRAARKLTLLGAGFVAPWAVTVAVYAWLGHLSEFYDWNVTRNFHYVAGSVVPDRLHVVTQAVALYVFLAAPVPWLLSLRQGFSARDRVSRGLFLLLGLSCIPVSLSGRFYSQYFIQFAVPLALLAAPQAATYVQNWGALRRSVRWQLALGVVVPVLFFLGFGFFRYFAGAYPYPCRDAKAREVSTWVRQHTAPDERIFVWGNIPPLYVLSERQPGTRYVTTAVHVGDVDPFLVPTQYQPSLHLSDRDIELTLADLSRNRPTLVIDTASGNLFNWSAFPLEVAPRVHQYVLEHYEPVGTPGGVRIYRIKPSSEPSTHAATVGARLAPSSMR